MNIVKATLLSRSGSWSYAHSPPEVTRSPHGLLHYTHCCTPPQTTNPITHCTDDTQLIALNSLLITLNTHSWLHWSHGYLSHGLPLCHCRVLFEHPPDVSHIPSLSVFCYSFCSMLPGSWSSACYLNYLSALPSGYCLPIVDHARLPEYSSALPSVYLFAICSTLPVFWLCLLIKASRWIRMPLILSALLQLYTGNLNLLSLFCLCFTHRGSELTTCKLLWSHHSMFPTTSAYDLTFFRFHCVHR